MSCICTDPDLKRIQIRIFMFRIEAYNYFVSLKKNKKKVPVNTGTLYQNQPAGVT